MAKVYLYVYEPLRPLQIGWLEYAGTKNSPPVDCDDSLTAYDPIGSWRYHTQSFPVRRSPRPRAVRRRPMATPPAPAWPSPKEKKRREQKVRSTSDSDNKERESNRTNESLLRPQSPSSLHPSPFPSPSSSTTSTLPLSSSMSSPGTGITPALGPTLLPTFVVRKKPRIGLVHRSSADRSRIVKRSFPLPVSFRTSAHRLLLWLPFLAVLEQVFSCLCLVLTPSTLCSVCVLCSLQVLTCATVPRSELVEAPCQALRRSLHHSIRPLVLWRSVLLSPDSLLGPAPCFDQNSPSV